MNNKTKLKENPYLVSEIVFPFAYTFLYLLISFIAKGDKEIVPLFYVISLVIMYLNLLLFEGLVKRFLCPYHKLLLFIKVMGIILVIFSFVLSVVSNFNFPDNSDIKYRIINCLGCFGLGSCQIIFWIRSERLNEIEENNNLEN